MPSRPVSREYPLPLQMDQSAVLYEAAYKKLGLHPFPSPRAILSAALSEPAGLFYCVLGRFLPLSRREVVDPRHCHPLMGITGNFKLVTNAMCYRVNSDNTGKVTGVSYYGPDRSDNTIEADIVIVAPFIWRQYG